MKKQVFPQMNDDEVEIIKGFLISPIGKVNTEVRNHADDVKKYIIDEAISEFNESKKQYDKEVIIKRADQHLEEGDVRDQMYKSIIGSHFCIAVLTYHNPNVFFETGVALTLNKPIIYLIDTQFYEQNGAQLPFDIQSKRFIKYDLSVRGYRERTYIKQVEKFLENLDKNNWRSSENGIDILKPCEFQDVCNFFEDAAQLSITTILDKDVKKTEEIVYIMDLDFYIWFSIDNFEEIMIRKANEGTEIKFLTMDEKNPNLDALNNKESILINLQNYTPRLANMAKKHENIEIRMLKKGCLTMECDIFDHRADYIPFFYSIRTISRPLWSFKRNSRMYTKILNEFNSIWELNTPKLS